MRILIALLVAGLPFVSLAYERVGPKQEPAPGKSATNPTLTQQGTVLSSIDVPSYTYIEVRQGKAVRWLAAATVKVNKGDTIRFDDGMVMTNHVSKTLNRTFSNITFVNRVEVGGKKM